MFDEVSTDENTDRNDRAGYNEDLNLGWGKKLGAVVCENCDWRFLHVSEKGLNACPFCFSSDLATLDQDQVSRLITDPPELFLSFAVGVESIHREINKFVNGIRFAPKDLTFQNLHTRLTRVYFPNWLVDVEVNAVWEAEFGYDYQVVSHRERFDQNSGRWKTQEITEARIRWEQRVGRLNRTYHNIRTPALEEDARLTQRIGTFEASEAKQFEAALMLESYVSLPSRSKEDAWSAAVPSIQSAASTECRQAGTADHIRQFRWNPSFDNQVWTLLLLPMYTTYYLDDDNAPQIMLVNGQSGRLYGVRKASMKRARQTSLVIAAVAVAVFLLGIDLVLVSLLLPPVLIFGGIGIFLSILLGFSAIIPIGMVWQFNNRKN
jgi:hypothetical protein